MGSRGARACPTGFVTILLAEAHARGLPAVAVYGFAPNYIQGVPNPRVSHALLQTFSAITGVPLQLNELDRAGRDMSGQDFTNRASVASAPIE